MFFTLFTPWNAHGRLIRRERYMGGLISVENRKYLEYAEPLCKFDIEDFFLTLH